MEKAIIKFNGGNPVFLCSSCAVILKRPETQAEVDFMQGKLKYLPPMYCEKCEPVKLDPKATCCPKCKSDWDGGSILETFIKQREEGAKMWQGMSDKDIEVYVHVSYSPPYRWDRKIGIELPFDHPNHYDGVSYWQCPDCKTTFNRFTRLEEKIEL